MERARRDLDAGTHLVNEALSSLERLWIVGRREELQTGGSGVPADREAENLRERLTELLRELEIVANRIHAEIGDLTSATGGMFPRAEIANRLTLEAAFDAAFSTKARLERWLPTDQERWADAFDLEAGPWAIHLTGNAAPTPRLVVSLRENQVGAPSVEPFLTLVRPAEGFETVNLDSSGSGKLALPAGDSVMLLQGDEVWEVRLSFRDR